MVSSCCARLATSSLTPAALHKVVSISRFSRRTSQNLFSRLFSSVSAPLDSQIAAASPSSQASRNVIDILQERGLVDSLTHEEGIRSICSNPTSSPVKVYCGFDPTAESLHLGNVLGLVVLSWFQRCGHIPVVLLGGATGRVGDPSGKSVERPALDEPTIEKNLKGVRLNMEAVFRVAKGNNIEQIHAKNSCCDSVELNVVPREEGDRACPAIILNNYDWWKDFGLLQFLRDVGKYARVGVMVAKESVKKRLNSDEGLSFTEFTYQLLQAYDFLHLFRNEGVSVQVGGSDQWGNITAGTELIRKILQQEGAYGLTFPLLLKADGTKFGKSEGGAIWLSPSMLSPYKFYQHLFATPDADIITFLKRLTFLSIEEIEAIGTDMTKPGYVENTAQRILAAEVTRFVHGEDGLEEAIKVTKALTPGGTTHLDWKAMEAISSELPSFSASHSDVVGSAVVHLCVAAGLLPTKGFVRRVIRQGGLYLNNERIDDEKRVVEAADLVENKMLLLSAGKKNKMVILVQ